MSAKPLFTFDGTASVDLGNYSLRKEKISVTGPLSDEVAARLTVGSNECDGYLKNDATGSDGISKDNASRLTLYGDCYTIPIAIYGYSNQSGDSLGSCPSTLPPFPKRPAR